MFSNNLCVIVLSVINCRLGIRLGLLLVSVYYALGYLAQEGLSMQHTIHLWCAYT